MTSMAELNNICLCHDGLSSDKRTRGLTSETENVTTNVSQNASLVNSI